MRENSATDSSTQTYEPPHIAEARQRKQAALKHRCPFCRSDPGQPCRAHRGRGREVDWPHWRRIELTQPAKPASRVAALCCVCGHQRTVSWNHHHRQNDPNHNRSDQGVAAGWRCTQSLKCQACGTLTRHAVLNPDYLRGCGEEIDLISRGGEPRAGQWSDEAVSRMRREYRAKFPQNPKLQHWYRPSMAKEARAAGQAMMEALCGAPMGVPAESVDTSTARTPAHELHKPGRVDWDTEYEDPETGLWWVDMDCVDCLRVANHRRRAFQRARLQWFLAHFGSKPELISDDNVAGLLEQFEVLWKAAP